MGIFTDNNSMRILPVLVTRHLLSQMDLNISKKRTTRIAKYIQKKNK